MKILLMYYYNLINPIIYENKEKYKIKDNDNEYIFEPITNIKELEEIYNLTSSNSNYYKIIKNNYQKLYTIYQNKYYVLMSRNINKNILQNSNILINKKSILDKTNWYYFWTKKIDYYEYQIKHIKGKYKYIDSTIDYFIGMSENAIQLVKYAQIYKTKASTVTICHRRITKENFYNPLYIVIDNKTRDIGEYLKYIFWNENYQNIDYIKMIKKSNLTEYETYLLIARIMYPSFYFDVYDRVVNNTQDEKDIENIIHRLGEYELYLNEIINVGLNKKNLISWLDFK